ncbi:hypothetical protein F4810DRAFT_643841 [Camillea tinctor]|nr:hypothetical protein F4810DRAFT_643841 [Camillea tinctor]
MLVLLQVRRTRQQRRSNTGIPDFFCFVFFILEVCWIGTYVVTLVGKCQRNTRARNTCNTCNTYNTIRSRGGTTYHQLVCMVCMYVCMYSCSYLHMYYLPHIW